MLNISKNQNGEELTFTLEGRLDTTTSPEFEQDMRSSIDGITSLNIDMKDLAYISSAGLRVLLSAQRIMNKQGKMVIRNASEEIIEIFEVTGFCDILTIE